MGEKRMFKRYIGIDYAGGDTPTKKLRTLAVYCAEENNRPVKVTPRKHPGDNWSRRGIAERLVEVLRDTGKPTLVGIDHAFGFPMRYFHWYPHLLLGGWDDFLDDFQKCWRTDDDHAIVRSRYYEQIERMVKGEPVNCRFGRGDWFRLTDPLPPLVKSQAASVFNFMTNGPVAFQTHAGLPWLRYIRQELLKEKVKVHFWPFDGWEIPEGGSAVVEVYPALWNDRYTNDVGEMGLNLSGDQRDAYSVARWMSEQDQNGLLRDCFNPECFVPALTEAERKTAKIEGWILGVTGPRPPHRR